MDSFLFRLEVTLDPKGVVCFRMPLYVRLYHLVRHIPSAACEINNDPLKSLKWESPSESRGLSELLYVQIE